MGIGINTILLLLLFQGLRYFSLKFQRREFVNPAKSYSYTKPYTKDIFENKKVLPIDWIALLVYMVAFLSLTILTVGL